MFEHEMFWVELGKLKPNPRNPHLHCEEFYDELSYCVDNFDIMTALVIDDDYRIISGNAKYEAAKRLKRDKVPVMLVEHLSEADKKAFALAEMELAKKSGRNLQIVKEDLKYLIDINYDLKLTGIEIPEIDIIINTDFTEASDDDKFPKLLDIDKRCEEGDIFALGKHKLVNGSALDELCYKILFDDNRFARTVTPDFPYNVKILGNVTTNKNHKEFIQASGEMSPEEFTDFLTDSMKLMKKYSLPGSLHYCFMDWRHMTEIMTAGNNVFDEFKNLIVWAKDTPGLGSHYRSQHELIFLFKNGKEPHINNIQLGKFGRNRSNVWCYAGMHATNPEATELRGLHSTVKPTNLLVDAILDSSNPNDIILDNFAGSGTTLIAAERCNRIALLIELDPHYCDVIIKRWEDATNIKAVKIGNIKDYINE